MVTLQRSSLSEDAWDALFNFLDPRRSGKQGPDRDREAEAKCLEVTRKLECFFASRGCTEAEDLAVEAMIRVAGRSRELVDTQPQDRIGYFYAVARNVLHEWLRDSKRERTTRESVRQDPTLLPIARQQSEEAAYRCLERCMSSLTQRARALLLGYYAEERTAKIESHRSLADEFGKSVNALRIEVHRIRKILRPCLLSCLETGSTGPERLGTS